MKHLFVLFFLVFGAFTVVNASVECRFVHVDSPGIGGAMQDIVIDPTCPDVAYAGVDMGALFKTEDGGRSWTILQNRDGLNPGLGGGSGLALDGRNPQTIWSASGEIYVSRDAGKSWEMSYPVKQSKNVLYEKIAVDPCDGRNVYATTHARFESRGHVLCTSDGGKTWFISSPSGAQDVPLTSVAVSAQSGTVFVGSVRGLYRSDDKGRTWSPCRLPDVMGQRVQELLVEGARMYVNFDVTICDNTMRGGIWYSDDNGCIWHRLGSAYEQLVRSICGDKKKSSWLFAAWGKRMYLARSHTACGIWRSNDGGESWQNVYRPRVSWTKGAVPRELAEYLQIPANQLNWPVVEAEKSKVNLKLSAWAPGLTRLAVAPGHPDIVYQCNQATVAWTRDGGESWEAGGVELGSALSENRWRDCKLAPTDHTHRLVGNGMSLVVPQEMAFSPFATQTFVTAYHDIGFRLSEDGGRTSSWLYDRRTMLRADTCNVNAVAWDDLHRDVLYCGGSDVFRSEDGGKTFSRMHLKPAWKSLDDFRRSGGVCTSRIRVWKLRLDPFDKSRKTLVVSTTADGGYSSSFDRKSDFNVGGIYRTTDGGMNWTVCADGLPAKIRADELVFDRLHSGVVWAGLSRSGSDGLYRSANGGVTWQKIAADRIGGVREDCIAIDGDTIYVVAYAPGSESGFWSDSALWKSTDGGANWTCLMEGFLSSVTVRPGAPNEVYLARPRGLHANGDCGIFRSKDGGATWCKMQTGLPDVKSRLRLTFDLCQSAVLIVKTPIGAWYARMGKDQGRDSLADGFAEPPRSAKPWVWYHWVDGNVTKRGITRDLEAMKAAGVGGFVLFSVGLRMPSGNVSTLSDDWYEHVRYLITEATRLGLEMGFQNCPGWSTSGGPWVKKEDAMKRYVITESVVSGGKEIKLPKDVVPNDLGIQIAVGVRERDPVDGVMPQKGCRLSSNIDFKLCPKDLPWMKNRRTGTSLDVLGKSSSYVMLDPGQQNAPVYLQFDYDAPVTMSGLVVEYARYTGKFVYRIVASEDGKTWRELATGNANENMTSIPFAKTTAQKFRFEVTKIQTDFMPVLVSSIGLSAKVSVPYLEAKTYVMNDPKLAADAGRNEPSAEDVLATNAVIDLTARLSDGGAIVWTPPSGRWRVFRLHSTWLERRNHPTDKSGCGLECDKMSKAAVEAFFAGMPSRIIDLAGNEAGRGKTLTTLMVDSYEAGNQNWTKTFPQDFNRLRGYSMIPFLPALAGRYVGDRVTTERFLADFRQTVEDLYEEAFGAHYAELVHARGLDFVTESYGGPFDAVRQMSHSDIPMGEFWKGGLQDGNAALAVDVARRFGKRIVQMESFTANEKTGRWTSAPWNLKRQGDFAMADGVNRFILHSYVHQPYDLFCPGMTLMKYGTHFNRNNTMWPFFGEWFRYLARAQYLLQQGVLAPAMDDVLVLPAGIKGIRRRLDEGEDICFIMNAGAEKKQFEVLVRGLPRLPERFDPTTGKVGVYDRWTVSDEGVWLQMELGLDDSAIIVLRKAVDRRVAKGAEPEEKILDRELTGPWSVHVDGRTCTMDRLQALSSSEDENLRYFSGTSIYETTFSCAEEPKSARLNLGAVGDGARVWVNGVDCGFAWFRPFGCDISPAVRSGVNRLRVEVTNTWVNRMIGDERLPADSDVARGPEYAVKSWPDWLIGGKESPTGRRAFAAYRHWKASDRPQPSGLMGPVSIFIKQD